MTNGYFQHYFEKKWVSRVTKRVKTLFTRWPESRSHRFTLHPRHVVASLDKAYMTLRQVISAWWNVKTSSFIREDVKMPTVTLGHLKLLKLVQICLTCSSDKMINTEQSIKQNTLKQCYSSPFRSTED